MAFNAYQQPYYQYGNQNYNSSQQYSGYQPNYISQQYQQQYPQQVQQYQQPIQQYQTTQQPTLYGKVVDGVDVVKAMDLPIGVNGIYPKVDMSAVFIKQWTPDGNTKIITYSPIQEEDKQEIKEEYSNMLNDLQKKINLIDEKITSLIS